MESHQNRSIKPDLEWVGPGQAVVFYRGRTYALLLEEGTYNWIICPVLFYPCGTRSCVVPDTKHILHRQAQGGYPHAIHWIKHNL